MQDATKTLSIVGSTGSIGTQALDIIRRSPHKYKVLALSAGSNLELLIKQIEEFKPRYVSIVSDEHKQQIQNTFPQVEVLKNNNEIAELSVDIFISAIVGIAGLESNLKALKNSSRVAIANKETLVTASHLVQEAIEKYGAELIPIDSEHAAIHHCLASYLGKDSSAQDSVDEIILTSSGGPFRTYSHEDLAQVSIEQALKHPTWSMGPKITIDSSTLMNKGLEVIEAHALFGIDYDKIKVIIHPQSIVHSAVTFVDGNTMAQLSHPDMRVPIQYAIEFPEKTNLDLGKKLNLAEIASLDFYEPDRAKFPALDLAYEAGSRGGSMPVVFNSVNEVAVSLFLDAQISYLDIVKTVEKEISQHQVINKPKLEEILALDAEIRSRYLKLCV